jgi:hypothetical protein
LIIRIPSISPRQRIAAIGLIPRRIRITPTQQPRRQQSRRRPARQRIAQNFPKHPPDVSRLPHPASILRH